MPDFTANSGVHTSAVCAPEFAGGRRRSPAPALRESTSFGRSRELSREPDASASNSLLKSWPRRHEISVLVGAILFEQALTKKERDYSQIFFNSLSNFFILIFNFTCSASVADLKFFLKVPISD